jgi:hypothetical protein
MAVGLVASVLVWAPIAWSRLSKVNWVVVEVVSPGAAASASMVVSGTTDSCDMAGVFLMLDMAGVIN